MNRGYVLTEMERYQLISKLKEARTNLIKLSTVKANRITVMEALSSVNESIDILTMNSGFVTKEA